MVEEDRACGARDRDVEIRALEDNVWRLAAELQRYVFQVARRSLHDQATYLGGSGEGNFAHAGVSCERSSRRFAKARDDVHHTGRYPSLPPRLTQPQRAD